MDGMNETSYGRAAMKKLAPVAEGFDIYKAGWLGDKPSEWDTMEVSGAVFREAKSGKNKGQRTVLVTGTKRTTYISKAEMVDAA